MPHPPAFIDLCNTAKEQIKEITWTATQQALQTHHGLLIDVREDHEWAQGHISGAIHRGRGIIERDIHTLALDTHTPIYLYCGGGYRSALAALNLQQMGYTHVHSIIGGYRAWTQQKK